MAEFHHRPKVKPYPLPDPGMRHRCMMSAPHLLGLEGDGNASDTAQASPWSRRPWQPLAMSREPSHPRNPPPTIQSQRSGMTSPARLHPPFPRRPPQPITCGGKHMVQEKVLTASQLVGHGVSMPGLVHSSSF